MDATPTRTTCGRTSVLTAAACCLLLASCETLKAPGSTADWFARNSGKSQEREVQSYRTQWQTRRDRAAIRWLLATQIHNGLTPDEVGLRLGEVGTREHNTREFKREGDGFRIDDEFYRFGPDRDGEVYYLSFREGHLINFDARLFADKKKS
jgi:hypothetical protein